MKVIVTLVGAMDHRRTVVWPDGWPIPKEGDSVALNPEDPNISHVRTVVWFPEGDEADEDSSEPFVYLVLGPARTVV